MTEGLRVYGQWAGNEAGRKENPEKCIASVYPNGSYIEAQCSRKRKVGDYCGQHAKQVEAGIRVRTGREAEG